jgi:translation elongation factor EF-Ts
MNKAETVNELMYITGKGKMACDISLSLTGGDIEKAIARMKISYPDLRVNRPNEEQNHDTNNPI